MSCIDVISRGKNSKMW